MSDTVTFGLAASVTLFVTIGPFETAAVFAGLTAGVHQPERRQLAGRSVLIAGGLLLAFALFGNQTLSFMHVSLPAFRFAGGVMLFLQALTLVFSDRSGMSSLTSAEKREALQPGDIAVFPLAFPLIAGPGSLAAIVLLTGRTGVQVAEMTIVLGALIVNLTITYIALRASAKLNRLLGVTGTDVVGRLSGILLAALAAQFIFDGVREAHILGP